MMAGLAPAAASSRAYYVTVSSGPEGNDIVLRKKDFSRHKTIYHETASPRFPHPEPRTDPFGEYVAWTMCDEATGGNLIAVKPVKEATWAPPGLLRGDYRMAHLIDWTEGGDLLAVVWDPAGMTLSVLDTKGMVKSQVPVDMSAGLRARGRIVAEIPAPLKRPAPPTSHNPCYVKLHAGGKTEGAV